MVMNFEQIQYDVTEAIATITLNRPDKLNALTKTMENELFSAMDHADKDDQVRVLILTGAGRGFCAGADISALDALSGQDLKKGDSGELKERIVPDRKRDGARVDFQKCWSYFPSIQKPIIAAINGHSVGLGFILPLYCDIRIASDQAKFGTAFSRRGLIAEHGVSWMLPRLIGISNALDLLFSARIIQADEALRMNLVSRVVPHDQFTETVRGYAAELAKNVSPRSMREMKREVYNALFQTLEEAIHDANADMMKSFACEDFKEGVAHFMEKRPPKFTGR